MLAWYYTETFSHHARAHDATPMAVPVAGEGMTLPKFGAMIPAAVAQSPSAAALPAVRPAEEVLAALPSSALLEPPLGRAPGALPPAYGVPVRPFSAGPVHDPRLAGAVFAQASRRWQQSPASGEPGSGPPAALPSVDAEEGAQPARTRSDSLAMLLHPGVLNAARAQLLPDQHLLLPKGTFIDCTLETAIDSTLPGMTTCVTATDTFSADGTVVLLERGTKLIGQTRGEVRQGQARVFVVWTEARTPAGVVVRLDSPGTDALGRSGLQGKVNRHFWQRFGAAALVSTIDGVVQSQLQSSSRGGTVVLDPTASEDVLTGILRSTVDIPPTVRVRNGSRIQVLVARDIDFRPVYELDPR